jgi:hypothetical protein
MDLWHFKGHLMYVFNGHLIYFVVVYIYLPILVLCCTKKNLATLFTVLSLEFISVFHLPN